MQQSSLKQKIVAEKLPRTYKAFASILPSTTPGLVNL